MSRYSFELDGKTIVDYEQMHNDFVEIMSVLDDLGADEGGDSTEDKLLDAVLSAVDESRKLF